MKELPMDLQHELYQRKLFRQKECDNRQKQLQKEMKNTGNGKNKDGYKITF